MTKIRTVVVDDEPMARERIIGMLNMEKDIEVVGEYSDSSEHLERRRAGDLGKRLMALVQDIKPEPQKLDHLVIKSGGRVFFLRTQKIDWIEAAGNYVKLRLGEDSHLFRETMNNMEGRLDRLYGSLHRFECRQPAENGLLVHIAIPMAELAVEVRDDTAVA